MKTSQTERQNDQLTPFTFGDHAVRTALVNGEPWFIAKDVCDILGIQNSRDTLAKLLPENEKGVDTIYTPGGKQEMLTVNEPGLYRLIFQSRKPEAERFKTWVFTEVLPRIRRGEGAISDIYSLFSDCRDMTIKRVNKLLYYFALQPPLSNTDIAVLTGYSDSNITFLRKRVSPEAAREAVARLGIDAIGHSANVPPRVLPPPGLPGDRPGFPLELPAKGDGDA
jgi:hypothetical protein